MSQDKKWTVEIDGVDVDPLDCSVSPRPVDLLRIEDKDHETICVLYETLEYTRRPMKNSKAHSRLIIASPQMRDLLRAFIAATEGVFECGHIRTDAMNLMKEIES